MLVIAESEPGAGDGGVITLLGTGQNNNQRGIETVVFDDGTVWSKDDLRALYFEGLSTSGNDTIIGFSSSDTFEAGGGNDSIAGYEGSDTYIYTRGDGEDSYNETMGSSVYSGANDQVVLHDILPSSVTFQRSGDDIILVIAESAPGAGDGGRITLVGNAVYYRQNGIESVTFDDGTTWSRADIVGMLLTGSFTNGNDTVVGTNANDTFLPGLGNDSVTGGVGNDTFIYRRGDGNDTFAETTGWSGGSGANDQVVLQGIDPADVSVSRSGENLVLVIAESAPGAGDGGTITLVGTGSTNGQHGVETVLFSDGTEWSKDDLRALYINGMSTPGNDTITGFNTPDVFEGGQGNDSLVGIEGSDTYIYTRGDGNDTVNEATGVSIQSGSNDQIILHDIAPGDVSFGRSGDDIILVIGESAPGAGDAGQITLIGTGHAYNQQGIETVVFDDGTDWSTAELRALYVESVSTSGNDTVTGFNTSEVFDAGLGNDSIVGREGDDTYVYTRGDGNDVVNETVGSSLYSGANDRVVLHGIDPSAVSVERIGTDLILVIAESAPGAGDGGTLRLMATATDYRQNGIEFVDFDNGTTWDEAYMRSIATFVGDAGNNSVTGTAANERFEGRGGNDTLTGSGGNDTFIFEPGFGSDRIMDFSAGPGAGDIIQFDQSIFDDFTDVLAAATQVGADVVITHTEGNITLKNVSLAALDADDFSFVL